MVAVVAAVVAATLAAIGLLHVYWALGGAGTGTSVTIPEVDGRPAFKPGPAVTLAVAALLEIAAALVALQGRLFTIDGLPPTLIRIGASGVALVLAARGVGDFRLVGLSKRVRGTRFARLDSRVFTPLCLVLAAGIVVVVVA